MLGGFPLILINSASDTVNSFDHRVMNSQLLESHDTINNGVDTMDCDVMKILNLANICTFKDNFEYLLYHLILICHLYRFLCQHCI